MNEGRTVAFAAIFRRAGKSSIAGDRIGAVDFFKMEIRESGDEARNASACSLNFYGNGDCVTVVFDAEDDREFAESRSVESLPELAFARSAVAEGDISYLVPLKLTFLN